MSSPDDTDRVGLAARPVDVWVPRPRDRRDPGLRTEPEDVMTLPFAGQPGHGSAAFLRNQPVRIVDGRFEGGYTGRYELICPGCGDHPHLDYSQVTPRLQWLRGPRRLDAALAAYHKHLGESLLMRPGLKPGGPLDAELGHEQRRRSAVPDPGVAEPTEVGVELSAEASPVVTDIRTASHSQDVRIGRGRQARDPRAGVGRTVRLAGQLGHGLTASIRRQLVRIVEGGRVGGYRDAFEVVCCDCGDHPYWDYSEIPLSLQRVRGPYTTMAAALAGYDRHLGLRTARRRS